MRNLIELFSRNWDFTVYKLNDKKVITVIFFDRIDYPRTFQLSQDEGNLSFEDFISLADKIRNNYEIYKRVEIIPPILE